MLEGSPFRSALFVPADRPERIEKALASAADAVIVDLEDAISPEDKDEARAAVAGGALRSPVRGRTIPLLRINSPLTEAGGADLEAVPASGARGVVVPKADPDSVALATSCGLPLIALVETAAGVFAAKDTASHPAVTLLMLGPVDLAAELGVSESHDGDELLAARGQLVLAAAAAGKAGPIDGPCVALRDEEALKLELGRAKRLGFVGKACIHPAQVSAVNAAFAPDAEEVAWAGRVLSASAAASGSVTVLEGQMVDRPIVMRARQILSNDERDG